VSDEAAHGKVALDDEGDRVPKITTW